MADIEVYKENEAFVVIDANERISKELWNYFSVFVENYRFMPKYKSGWWDGKIRFFKENRLPIGLLYKIPKFARGGGYSYNIQFNDVNDIDPDEFQKFIQYLNIEIDGKRITPRDYQAKAAYEALRYRRLCIESKTGSGKSLIIYIIVRFFEYLKIKTLLVVPRINLVEQMVGDFESYGWKDTKDYIAPIFGGERKVFGASVIISTWQSIYKNDELFSEFGALIIDEAHNAKAKSLTRICENAINASYRLGFSGTYHEKKNDADRMSIEGNLGPIKSYTTYEKLIKDGHLSDMKIFGCVFDYPLKFRRKLWNHSQGDYAKEMDFLIQIPERNFKIMKMVDQCKNNVLVLFTKIEKHGRPLLALFQEKLTDRQIIYIDGSVSGDQREKARKIAEKNNNVVILASYGTYSEGINIKNIHNIIFASSYKSKIKVLQSIGRGLRKLGTKVLKLFDVVDNVSLTTPSKKKYVNHSMRHYKKRKKMYEKEGFKYQEVKVKIDPRI